MVKLYLGCWIEKKNKSLSESVVLWIEGMNLVLSSNQISERRDNQTNDFKILIKPPLDTQYGNYFIKVNEFMYPRTISTIHAHNREDFSCLLSLKFSNYMLHSNRNSLDSEVEFQMDEFVIPNGNYLNQKEYYFGVHFG